MIFDLDNLPPHSQRECQICIIGSGAAGLAIAQALASSGLDVLMLESGAEPAEPPIQALYQCDFTELPVPGAIDGRFRILGGSTTEWGGQSLPLTPLDFAARPWVPHSGWPISPEELGPHYQAAAAYLMTDAFNFDTDLFGHLRAAPPPFAAGSAHHCAHYNFSKWSPRPNLRLTYVPLFAASKTMNLCCHASVTQLRLDAGHGQISGVIARSLGGNEITVRAGHVLLCCGAIENARLLLASNQQIPAGVGNSHDLVGRYFMEHPGGEVGTVEPASERAAEQLQAWFNTFYRKHEGSLLRYTPRLAASAQLQQSQSMLNASAMLTFLPKGDSPYTMVRDALSNLRYGRGRAEAAKALLRGALSPGELAVPAYKYLVAKRAYVPNPRIGLSMLTEQEPNPESRVTLGPVADALGMARSRINWQLTDHTRRTVLGFAGALQADFAKHQLGTIRLDERLLAAERGWQAVTFNQKHHMGTTRMSDDPSFGVLDRDLRVHGIANLWVGSASAFPTGGHSNPTLTLIALSLRLAGHVKSLLAGR